MVVLIKQQIMNTILICFALAALCIGCNRSNDNAQYISDYKLRFDKNEVAGNGSFSVSFRIEPNAPDTVVMLFGMKLDLPYANYESDSTMMLVVESDNIHDYIIDNDNQIIKFIRTAGRPSRVSLRYDYANLAVCLSSRGKHPVAEVWETSYDEFYYPFVPQTHMDFHAEFVAPDGVEVLCSYPVEKNGNAYVCDVRSAISHSLQMAFLDTSRLRIDTMHAPHPIRVYQIKGQECSSERFDEIACLLSDAHIYFRDVFKSTSKHPVKALLFADSMMTNGGARYNINFISAPQYKAATYDYIIPLAHEVGHSWLGEYNLLNDFGAPGSMFMHESLNEFMTGMFVRSTYGEETYKNYRERVEQAYEYYKIKGTEYDRALIDMRYNSNHAVVYVKGPLILDEFAQRIGYDEMVRVIAEFYRRHDLKPGLRYEDFIATVADLHPEIAEELDQRIRNV